MAITSRSRVDPSGSPESMCSYDIIAPSITQKRIKGPWVVVGLANDATVISLYEASPMLPQCSR